MENNAIDKLCRSIGRERTARVLSFALPHVQQFEQDLRTQLLTGDRQAAQKCAHRALSSVRAGTERLETLLSRISQEDCVLAELQPPLSAEFDQVIQHMQSWLDQQDSTPGCG
ncbi:MAG: hypothetical protein R3E95_14900 [Thiolinea sp.]